MDKPDRLVELEHNIVEAMSEPGSFADKQVAKDLDRRFAAVVVLPAYCKSVAKDNNMQLKLKNLILKSAD
jgi:hypothetical protein